MRRCVRNHPKTRDPLPPGRVSRAGRSGVHPERESGLRARLWIDSRLASSGCRQFNGLGVDERHVVIVDGRVAPSRDEYAAGDVQLAIDRDPCGAGPLWRAAMRAEARNERTPDVRADAPERRRDRVGVRPFGRAGDLDVGRLRAASLPCLPHGCASVTGSDCASSASIRRRTSSTS